MRERSQDQCEHGEGRQEPGPDRPEPAGDGGEPEHHRGGDRHPGRRVHRSGGTTRGAAPVAGMAAAVSIKSAETSANASPTGIETGRSARVTARKAATAAGAAATTLPAARPRCRSSTARPVTGARAASRRLRRQRRSDPAPGPGRPRRARRSAADRRWSRRQPAPAARQQRGHGDEGGRDEELQQQGRHLSMVRGRGDYGPAQASPHEGMRRGRPVSGQRPGSAPGAAESDGAGCGLSLSQPLGHSLTYG